MLYRHNAGENQSKNGQAVWLLLYCLGVQTERTGKSQSNGNGVFRQLYKILNTHNTRREDAKSKTFAPFLFAYSPQGKKKTQQHTHKDKTREQAKDNQNKADKVKDKKQVKR